MYQRQVPLRAAALSCSASLPSTGAFAPLPQKGSFSLALLGCLRVAPRRRLLLPRDPLRQTAPGTAQGQGTRRRSHSRPGVTATAAARSRWERSPKAARSPAHKTTATGDASGLRNNSKHKQPVLR
ncbi:hypothetical protein NDU88_007178 [Pleurodeles waltl]|uniref:Uncharacterized protein n=1 Tax=Pleurodeles waltl TaxID=8319 RepID=A0AAV7U0Q7_PLEWA|nr:hypothetical protein NDU88_007178 [Pleurodeles waltl]